MEIRMTLLKPFYAKVYYPLEKKYPLEKDRTENPEKHIVKWTDLGYKEKEFFGNRKVLAKIGKTEKADIIWQTGAEFRTKTHLKAKSELYCIPLIVLIQTPQDGNINIDDFKVYYKIEETENPLEPCELKQLKVPHEGDNNTYRCFLQTKAWFKKGKIISDPAYSVVGTVQAGYTDIVVKNKKDGKIIEELSRKLWVCPSFLTERDFDLMLDDLNQMPQHVLQLDKERAKEAKLFVYGNWKEGLYNIYKKLRNLDPWLDKINQLPRGNLRPCRKLEMRHKIKKFNHFIVRQYLMDRNKRKFLVDDTEHTVDIYEHRVFYAKLLKLKEEIECKTNRYVKELEDNKDRKRRELDELEKSGALNKTWDNSKDIKDRKNNIEKIKKTIEKVGYGQEKAIRLLDKLSNLAMFKGVQKNNEGWRLTQILTNDDRYNEVYKILQPLDSILLPPSLNKNEFQKIFLYEMDKVYEFWILAKMLKVLSSQQWQLLKEEKPKKFDITKIYKMFVKKKFAFSETEEWSIHFTVKHEVSGLEMDIYYNTPIASLDDTDIKGSLEDLIDKNKKVKKKDLALRPDFLFRVRKIDKDEGKVKEKIFILDAKTRRYKEQCEEEQLWKDVKKSLDEKSLDEKSLKKRLENDMATNCWLFKDVETVGYEKYIYRLSGVLKKDVKVTASFIVHTDCTTEDKDTRNSSYNEYTGKYVTYNATSDRKWTKRYLEDEDMRKTIFKMVNSKDPKKLGEYKDMFHKDKDEKYTEEINKIAAKEQQIGSFFMVPGNEYTEENLKTFFAMIFEYYMEVDNICWSCGTPGDKEENGYKCNNPNCADRNHYWNIKQCRNRHRIVKHWNGIKNYHIIINSNGSDDAKGRTPKNAVCPVCKEFWKPKES